MLNVMTTASASIALSLLVGPVGGLNNPPEPSSAGLAQLAYAEPPASGPAANAPKSVTPTDSPTKSDAPATKRAETTSADDALKLLQEGNARWVADQAQNPNDSVARRAELAEKGQKPVAAILTCADSRLPVERVFDRGVGELFVVRVAGNIAGDSETGTLEYGVEHLKIPVIVVMGHSKCGAVAGATGKELPHGKLGKLVSRISPAVDRARKGSPGTDDTLLLSSAIRENVWQTIYDLMKTSPDIRASARSGELQVVGAICDISTGRVDWMGEHPWQTEILAALDRPGVTREAKADDSH